MHIRWDIIRYYGYALAIVAMLFGVMVLVLDYRAALAFMGVALILANVGRIASRKNRRNEQGRT